MVSQICKTFRDVLFFSLPFAFQSWQTQQIAKKKYQIIRDALTNGGGENTRKLPYLIQCIEYEALIQKRLRTLEQYHRAPLTLSVTTARCSSTAIAQMP